MFHKLFGDTILPEYSNWVSVSIKQAQGGTAIPKAEKMVELNYQSSTCECSQNGRGIFDDVCHTGTMKEVWERMKGC